MQRLKRILVGLDLGPRRVTITPGSRRAVEQALWLAPRLDARVTLIHATAADESYDDRENDYVVVPEGILDAGRAALESVAEEFRQCEIPVELVISEEKAWIALARQVVRQQIDLVLVGKRSTHGLSEHRIGSVSAKLLRFCPCAVWVIKLGSGPPPKRILAATDRTEDVGKRVISYAAYLAAQLGAALDVVHAIPLPFRVQMEGEAAEEAFERREIAASIHEIRQTLDEDSFSGDVSFHVGVTSPTRAILRCAGRVEPGLVVMGTVSRGGLAGIVVGNTAERLLDRLDCSLLTVKPEDFVCPADLGGKSTLITRVAD